MKVYKHLESGFIAIPIRDSGEHVFLHYSEAVLHSHDLDIDPSWQETWLDSSVVVDAICLLLENEDVS